MSYIVIAQISKLHREKMVVRDYADVESYLDETCQKFGSILFEESEVHFRDKDEFINVTGKFYKLFNELRSKYGKKPKSN